MSVTVFDVQSWMKATTMPTNNVQQLDKVLQAVKAYLVGHYDNLPDGGEDAWTADIDLAVTLECARQFARAKTPQGVDVFAELGAVRVSRFLDPDATRILDRYLLPAIA